MDILLLILVGLSLPSPLFAQPNHPGQEFSSRQMAEFYLFQKRYDEAIKTFHEVLGSGENDGYVFRGLVNAYRGANQQTQGEAYLKEYSKKNLQSSSVLYGLGYLYYLEGRNEEGEQVLIQAVDADPGNALALNNLGAVMARKKSFAEAVRLVKNAIEIDPQELMFFRNLQIIYDQMNLQQKFSSDYEKYKREGPPEIAAGYGKSLARTFRQKGFQFYSQGKLQKAIKKFSELVVIYREINYRGGLVPGLFSLGLLYEETGDHAKAQEYFHEVLKINPEHIQARERVQSGQVEKEELLQ